MTEGLKKKLHTKNDHRGHVQHLITEFSRINQEDSLNLKKLEKSLEEKVKIFKNLDDELFELTTKDETETLANEIDKLCQFLDEINNILVKIESLILKIYVRNSSAHTNHTAVSSVSSNPSDSHAKLAKLTLDKFNGESISRQSFWDQYSVAIHINSLLCDL